MLSDFSVIIPFLRWFPPPPQSAQGKRAARRMRWSRGD
jgi:hypothetical protein